MNYDDRETATWLGYFKWRQGEPAKSPYVNLYFLQIWHI